MQRQITHVRKDNHGNITHVGNPSVWGILAEATVISHIDNGQYSYYVYDGVRSVDVHVVRPTNGAPYLKTVADGRWSNNLDNLPAC